MTRTQASAPGKVILLGEHAVVYGYPAIAVPVSQVRAFARVQSGAPGEGCLLVARDLGTQVRPVAADPEDGLAAVIRLTLACLDLPPDPDWRIELHSHVPMAGGLGSGAAAATALVRALAAHAERTLTPRQVADLVFESERIFHGTPSGIDNTVIAFEQPIWFEKGREIQLFRPAVPFTLAIADTGVAGPTRETVAEVRRAREAQPEFYEAQFTQIGRIVLAARRAMEAGRWRELGPLFNENQQILAQIGVSAEVNERLIRAALAAGALGAKLSGGGRGGNIIALPEEGAQDAVGAGLLQAGARRVLITRVDAAGGPPHRDADRQLPRRPG